MSINLFKPLSKVRI